MASRSLASALAPPACLETLRAAFAERAEIEARITAAEADTSFQRAVAVKARAAAEGAAAGVALRKISDTEADALDGEAAAAAKASRRAERLLVGLRQVLGDTDARIAALAAPARESLLAWAYDHTSANLAVRYAKLAAEVFGVIREVAALRDAADLSWGDTAAISLPVDILDVYGAKLHVGIGELTPLATPASDLAAEAQILIRRAERMAERTERDAA